MPLVAAWLDSARPTWVSLYACRHLGHGARPGHGCSCPVLLSHLRMISAEILGKILAARPEVALAHRARHPIVLSRAEAQHFCLEISSARALRHPHRFAQARQGSIAVRWQAKMKRAPKSWRTMILYAAVVSRLVRGSSSPRPRRSSLRLAVAGESLWRLEGLRRGEVKAAVISARPCCWFYLACLFLEAIHSQSRLWAEMKISVSHCAWLPCLVRQLLVSLGEF